MLKALELTGFKSFADKTRFEFPPGITVVVGPNGSGKSNIVDAIKWVLGEQSAKSLRGKEMADVIFKGSSGPNGRKPANSATATIILDNSDRRFQIDGDEVVISRRVYRSGEGEYLINNEVCRLKDIRDMFRGTGIGTDAYSLIEQGKVDRLLQASAKDRRVIFEEAAGISRFKANKIEAQRRLARVDGNLIRLADLVEEVGGRYRSIKQQASKAAKYKELASRLQELRTYVSLKDWRSISEKVNALRERIAESTRRETELRQWIAEAEEQSDRIERQLELDSASISDLQNSLLATQQAITEQRASQSLNESRIADLEARAGNLHSEQSRLSQRQIEVQERETRVAEEVARSRQLADQQQQRLTACQTELNSLDDQIESARIANEAARADSLRLVGTISELGRRVSASNSQVESLTARQTSAKNSLDELSASLLQRKSILSGLVHQRQQLELDAESKDSDLARARKQLEQTRQQRAELEAQIADLKSNLSGKTQRSQVLQELEKRLEGVDAGARQLLEQNRKSAVPPYNEIVGVVADMLHVNVQHAAIVDVALGNAAQYIVVDGDALIEALANEKIRVKGRVGIIQYNSPPSLGADPNVSINGEPGVIGRADRLVQVDQRHAAFVRKLLGGTWIVQSLADAISLFNRRLGRIRMVTLDGEIVEADGAVIVGPKVVVTGLISRRSELRSLAKELAELNLQIRQLGEQRDAVRLQEKELESHVHDLLNENTQLSRQLSDIAIRSEELEKQNLELAARREAAAAELELAKVSLRDLAAALAGDQQSLVQYESRLQAINQTENDNETLLAQLRSKRLQFEAEVTEAKIHLAKTEQQLESHSQLQKQLSAQARQAADELLRLEQQSQSDSQLRENAVRLVAEAGATLARLTADLKQHGEQMSALNEQKSRIDEQRRDVNRNLHGLRQQLRDTEDELHKAELKSSHLGIESNKLAERMLEDYGLNLVELDKQQLDDLQTAEREAIDEEIASLRQKIGAVGSVNMEALAELEEIELRYNKMDEQYRDLVAAKQSLENIIQRINADSRKLFVETLDAIRGNFQSLFRQTFGGGKADIVLEEGVDPLEAGVEIVATPPGKPDFNNSLLSGGEKALTAVSLLMAIFQFRPSPFCVLDEVDAPFDEANIGRFIEVLRSFLGWTKFVIVTHSKKTMTAATTLCGVTMQESGVSKRVSVHFEDVSEDGQIAERPLLQPEERGVA